MCVCCSPHADVFPRRYYHVTDTCISCICVYTCRTPTVPPTRKVKQTKGNREVLDKGGGQLTIQKQLDRPPKLGGYRRGTVCKHYEKCRADQTPCKFRCFKYLQGWRKAKKNQGAGGSEEDDEE